MTQAWISGVTRDLVDKVERSCLVPFMLELSDPDVQLVRLGSQVAKVELETLDGTWPGRSQPFGLQPGWISLRTYGGARMHEVSNTWSWNDWKICVCECAIKKGGTLTKLEISDSVKLTLSHIAIG